VREIERERKRGRERRIILGVGPNVISLFCFYRDVIVHNFKALAIGTTSKRLTGPNDAVKTL
jgi:hypothetical protein